MSALPYIDFDFVEQSTAVIDSVNKQGSDEWLQERVGYITASRVSDMLAGGKGVGRDKYKAELIAERLTSKSSKSDFKNSHMERGNLLESSARDAFNLIYDGDVVEVGFIKHPTIKWLGASPDGLVGEEGLIEIKSTIAHVHLDYLLEKKVPRNYLLQMQLQMAVTGRKYCDFVSYCEDYPPRLRMAIIRVDRDNKVIGQIEEEAIKFNEEISLILEELKNL